MCGQSRTSRKPSAQRLAGPERDDASDGIVGRHANGHAISRDNLDAEAAHSAAELSQHFMAGVALNAVKAAAVNGHHGTLHVDEIVLAQTASSPFMFLNKHCATLRAPRSRLTAAAGFGLQAHLEKVNGVPHKFLTASSTCRASAS